MTASLNQSKVFYLVLTDLEGNYTFANDHYKESFVAQGVDLLSTHWSERLNADGLEHAYIAQKKILNGVSKTEIVNLKKRNVKDEMVWTEWEFLPIYDENQKINGVSCVGYIIPDYLDKALEQSNYNQHVINTYADTTSSYLCLKDSDFKYVQLNQSFANYLNIDKDEIYYKGDDAFYEPEIAQKILATDLEASKLPIGSTISCDISINDRYYNSLKFPFMLKDGSVGIGSITVDSTEKIKFKNELQAKEAFLQNLTDNINGSVTQFRVRPDGTVEWEFVSKGIEKIFEVSPESLKAHPTIIREMVPPDELKMALAKMDDALKNLRPSNYQHSIITPSGAKKWVEISTVPQLQNDLSVIWYGFHLDVTEKKELELKNKSNQDLLLNITNNLNAVISRFKMQADGHFSWDYMSKTAEALYEVSAEEIVKDPNIMVSLIHPEDLQGAFDTIKKSYETKAPIYNIRRIITKSGKLKWVEVNSFPETQADGSTIWNGFHMDITERKLLEIENTKNQELVKNLTNNIDGVIIQVRYKKLQEPIWEFVSDGVQNVFEIDQEYLFKNPKALRDVVIFEDKKQLEDAIALSFNTCAALFTEMRIVTKSGIQKWIRLKSTPTKQKNGDIVWCGFYEDITCIKALEIDKEKNQNLIKQLSDNINGVLTQIRYIDNSEPIWEYATKGLSDIYEIDFETLKNNPLAIRNMIDSDQIAEYLQKIKESKGFDNINTQYNLTTPSGKQKWIEVNSVYQIQKDGSKLLHSFHDDVTEKKAIERKVAENEKFLQNLTNNINGVITQFRYTADGQTICEFVSKGVEVIYELTFDELQITPHKLLELLSDEDAIRMVHEVQLANEQRKPLQIEYQITTKSGMHKWIKINSIPRQQDNGDVVWHGFHEEITCIKELEFENKKNQDLLKNLTENVSGALTQFRAKSISDYNYDFISKGAEKIYEIDRNTLIANPDLIMQMIHPDDFDRIRKQVYNSFLNLVPLNYQFRIKTPSGKKKWIGVTSMPQKQPDGTVVWHGFDMDITDKKEIEEQIEQNEKFLLNLTDNINGMISQLQVYDYGNIQWNFLSKGIEKLYEISVNDAQQNSGLIHSLISQKDAFRTRKEFIYCLDNLLPYYSQHRIVTPKGIEKWVEINSIPQKQKDGSVIWHGFHQDITQQQKLQIKNKETQKQLDFIVNNTVSALILVENNKISYISKNYQSIFGPSIKEEMKVIEENIWKLAYFEEERISIKKQYYDAIKKQEKNILLQYQYMHKNGKIIWRQDKINVFYDKNGRAIKIVDLVSDKTKTKRLENLVHRKNSELAKQVVEKEKIANNFVEFQNSKWEEIAGNLHDNISQLLFATNLHLNNFSHEHISYKKAKDILQIALQEIKYITQATKNLVIQNKELQLALKEFIANNNFLNNIKITKIASKEFYEHFSNSEQIILFTIIQEVIQNAIKHSKSSEVYLILAVENGVYTVKIIDNGIGLPANYINGMGIYNIEKNVSLLNGTIKMYNDDGLTVEINLP